MSIIKDNRFTSKKGESAFASGESDVWAGEMPQEAWFKKWVTIPTFHRFSLPYY